MEQTVKIPEEVIEICRDMAKIAKAAGLRKFDANFSPNPNVWKGDISLSWERGRYNEDANKMKVSSNFTVFEKVDS